MVAADPESFADLDGHDPDPDRPKKDAHCSFFCRLRIVFSQKQKTVPAPPGFGGPASIYNAAAGFFNFSQRLGYVASGDRRLLDNRMPYMRSTNKEDAEVMDKMDLAILLIPIPGLEEEEAVEIIERHHLLLQEKALKEIFESVGLDIEEFTIRIRQSKHRLKSGEGLHTKAEGIGMEYGESFCQIPKTERKCVFSNSSIK
jgi:hypothetical protein